MPKPLPPSTAIAFRPVRSPLVLAMLIAVVVALWVSSTDTVVVDWIVQYWNRFLLWVQHLVS